MSIKVILICNYILKIITSKLEIILTLSNDYKISNKNIKNNINFFQAEF